MSQETSPSSPALDLTCVPVALFYFMMWMTTGAGVGSEDLGSWRGFQRRGVCESEKHADSPEQQLLWGVPQQQPGGSAQHAGQGALAPPPCFSRRSCLQLLCGNVPLSCPASSLTCTSCLRSSAGLRQLHVPALPCHPARKLLGVTLLQSA